MSGESTISLWFSASEYSEFSAKIFIFSIEGFHLLHRRFSCVLHRKRRKYIYPLKKHKNSILSLLDQAIIFSKQHPVPFTHKVQGSQEKLCFFTIHCNPSLAYIAVRDLQCSQRNVSVQSLLLAGNFLHSWEKNNIY